MVKYQEVLHGSTSELYINGEREELVTKIEIKMTGDFEDSSFCGEYGTIPHLQRVCHRGNHLWKEAQQHPGERHRGGLPHR